jgi:hypothetical protein
MPTDFILPDDSGLIGIVDAAPFQGFVSPDWTLASLFGRFKEEMARRRLLLWGTGADYGNWRLRVQEPSSVKGYRTVQGPIEASGTALHLCAYEHLTVVAQFADKSLPGEGGDELPCLSVTPGLYVCRIVQLYDPALAMSSEVFERTEPHFLLELEPTTSAVPAWTEVPWFQVPE